MRLIRINRTTKKTTDNININDTGKRGAALVNHGNVPSTYILADNE